MAANLPAQSAESLKKLGSKWLERIRAAEKREEKFNTSAESAEAIYSVKTDDGHAKQYFNILHSNVETIVPATYNSTPAPDIRRRFNDKDPVAKAVADVLERAITVQIDDGALDAEMEGVSQSAFLAGRGVVRIRLQTDDAMGGEHSDPIADAVEDTAEADDEDESGEGENPTTEPVEPPPGPQKLLFEAVAWKDFRMGPAKRWADVPWVSFRHSIAEETMEEWESDDTVQAQNKLEVTTGSEKQSGDVEVWEVWNKSDRTVYFIHSTNGTVYKQLPDMLGLSGFFPCPEPVQPIKVVGSMVPVTPYAVYEELAAELEQVTKRIRKIVKGVVVRGGAAAGETLKEISKIANLDDNEIGEIRGVEAMAQQGGLEKAITWWPIEKAIAALAALAQHREAIKAQIYEVTGISDIVRGASNAAETARAQEIKTQWGSLRIQKMQRLLERCVRDLFVMAAELISAKFTRQNLMAMTGVEITPQMDAILSDRVTQFYRVNVESESTVKSDMTKTRGEMAQFLQGTAQYMQTVGPLVQQGVVPAPLALEIYSAFARSFKLGKSAEDAIAQIGQQIEQAGQQGAQQPNPQAEAEKAAAAETQQKEDAHQQSQRHKQEAFELDQTLKAKAHAFEMSKKGAAEGDPAMGGGYVDKADMYGAAVMQALQAIMQAVTAPRVSQIQTGPDGQKRAISMPVINQPAMVN